MSSPRQPNESVEQPKQPSLCANNCGFFSNEACSGFCSKCYRAQLESQRREQSEAKTEQPAEQQPVITPTLIQKPQELELPVQQSIPPPRERKSPSKCFQCRKKVGLTGFVCKCGEVFCGKHRHPESHKCPFDHRSAERRLLAEQNPVIKGAKFERL